MHIIDASCGADVNLPLSLIRDYKTLYLQITTEPQKCNHPLAHLVNHMIMAIVIHTPALHFIVDSI